MRLVLAFAALLAALPFGGCLKSKDHFTLAKDGSGTISSSYTVDLTAARELLSAAAMLTGQGSPDAVAKLTEDKLMNFEHPGWFHAAAARVEGYRVTSASQSMTGAEGEPRQRVTSVETCFDSLDAASQADAFAITAITLSKVEPTEELPKGAWKLVLKDAFSGLDPSQTGGMDATSMLPMFEQQLKKKLSTTIAFTVPGKILETNGTKSEDGRTASTEITYDRILEGKSLALTIVFEAAEDVKLKPFTASPDLMKLMQRLQGTPPEVKKDEPKGEAGGAEGEDPDAGDESDEEQPDAKKADEKKPSEKKADETPEDDGGN